MPGVKGRSGVYPRTKTHGENLSKALMGHIPWNKGTKGLIKPNKTSFKKGQIPWNEGSHLTKELIKEDIKNQKAIWDNLSEADKGYIAGIIDGEGCIGLSKYYRKSGRVRYSPLVRIQMTDYETIRYFYDTFSGSYCYKRKAPLNWKDQWQWAIDFRGGYEFIKCLLPYLRIKKRQAEMFIEYYDNAVFVKGKKLSEREIESRENYYQALKKLNKRGK